MSPEARRTHCMRRTEKRKRVRMQFTAPAVTAVPNDDSRAREQRSPIKGEEHINKKRRKKEKHAEKRLIGVVIRKVVKKEIETQEERKEEAAIREIAYVHFHGEGPKQSPACITLRAWRDVIHLVVNATRSVPIKGS